MGFNLQPREYFTIVRHLPDPGDSSTSYVRAIVRNSLTGATLDTLNLSESGANTHRFTYNYQVPADVSGLGFYIDITTYVYTDSGYTSKSTVYGEDNNTYLVFDRFKKLGGGGSDVDYKRIAKMLAEAIKKIEMPDMSGMELSPVIAQLQDIKKACDTMCAMEIPTMPDMKSEMAPVLTAIQEAEKEIISAIDTKEVTEATDLSPLHDAISKLGDAMGTHTSDQAGKLDSMVAPFQELHDKFKSTFHDEYPQLNEALDALVKKMREAFLYTNSMPSTKKSPEDRVKTLIG